MKYYFFFSTLIIFSLYISSCKSTNSLEQIDDTANNVPQMLFQLKKSPCYGECPVFVFQVYDNHTAFYRGLRYVNRIGDFTSSITDKEIDTIIELLNEADYNELKEQYMDYRILDLPTTVLSHIDKNVQYHYNLAPEELINLTKEIEILMNNLNWQETPSDKKS